MASTNSYKQTHEAIGLNPPGGELLNLLLVGLGAHARRIWYPTSLREGRARGFRIAYVVDLASEVRSVEAYLSALGESTPVWGVPSYLVSKNELPQTLVSKLDNIVLTHQIAGVIVSTEPLSHAPYVRWALQRGLSVMVEKPLSSHAGIASTPGTSKRLVETYDDIAGLYVEAKKRWPTISCSIVAQRRYHRMFRLARDLVREVFDLTNCPVTSIQAYHADGQWRMPSEYVDINYHPFNSGYGKLSHSGYHFLDIIPWIIEAAETPEKSLDSVDVLCMSTYPADIAAQLNDFDLGKTVMGYTELNAKRRDSFNFEGFGEVDAFVSLAFKSRGRTMTLGSCNLLHTSFSRRGWLEIEGRDLYKGNGRVRHESHIIQQGPFQALILSSFQAGNREEDAWSSLGVGGQNHFHLDVFRNSSIIPTWKAFERIEVQNVGFSLSDPAWQGHQEEARKDALREFIANLRGNNDERTSDLLTHRRSVVLMAAAYESSVRRQLGTDALVIEDFRISPGHTGVA